MNPVTKTYIKTLLIGVAALTVGIWHLVAPERTISIFIGIYFVIYAIVELFSLFKKAQ